MAQWAGAWTFPKNMFSQICMILHARKIERICNSTLKKIISNALFLHKWDVFEHRRFSDYAVLFGTGLYYGIRLYGLHKKLLKFACLRSFFHSILVSP